jgi:hypothetical protein
MDAMKIAIDPMMRRTKRGLHLSAAEPVQFEEAV